jgi:Zn-dependent M28 family amino/carboxypeptidase
MRRILICSALFAVLSFTVAKSAPQAKPKAAAAAYGNTESISENELKVYLYFLASDQLEGRNLPSRGFDTAALYVASHLAEWGLKPGGSTANTVGPLQPYMMPMPMLSKSVNAEESKVSLTAPGGRGGGRGARGNAAAGPQTTDFGYTKDWTVTAGGRGAPPLEATDVTGGLVFAGNGYVVNKSGPNKSAINPYEGLDVKGKVIVVAGLPAEVAAQQAAAAAGRGGRGGRGGGAAPEAAPAGGAGAAPAANANLPETNPLGEPCKDFLTPEQYGAQNGALAVVTIANFQQLSAMANPAAAGFGGFGGGGGGGGRAGLNGPNFQVPMLQAKAACASVPVIQAGLTLTNAIFQGEKANAQQIFYAAGMNAKQDSFDLTAEKKLKVKVTVNTIQGHGENVVGILEGSDPVLKNEYVVMSGHLDHIGLAAPLPDGHNVNNGADDDGSGSTGLLAIARAYAEGAAKGMRPKRSIIFLWMAGEEKGLWGSQLFVEYPFVDLSKVVANLNMDMIGRTKGPGFTDSDPTHVLVKPGEILLVGPNISSDDLEKTIETVNTGFQNMDLNHFYDATAPDATHDNLGPQPRGQRIFYRSDHYNFAKMGIPIAFFTTGLHPDYHRATDTPDKIDYKEMQMVTKTVSAVGWVLANQAGRPQLKKDLPEQLLKDMKTARDQGWGKLTPVMPPVSGMPY